jgi:putative transposase
VAEALGKLSHARPRLAGTFRNFRDVLVTDSTILRLHNALEEHFPSIWRHYMRASAKLNVVMNVAGRGPKRLRLAAGCTHDLHLLTPGRWMRGKLMIFDLAYFQCEMFAAIGQQQGWYLCRLKAHTNPRLVRSHQAAERWAVGYGLQPVIPHLSGDSADFEGEIPYRLKWGQDRSWQTLRLRVVGVWDETAAEYRWYATNAPPALLEPQHICATYAARWEVELLFRELKTHYRIDQLPTRRRTVTESLIYAAVLTMLLGRRLRQWRTTSRPALAARATFDRWAVVFGSFAHDVLDVLFGPRGLRLLLARRLKRLLLHEAKDPNL